MVSRPFLFTLKTILCMRLIATLVFLLHFPSLISLGQDQLILFKREKVLARFSYGDDFIYKLKKSTHYTAGFITQVREFSVITFNDTILFTAIDRVSLKGHPQKPPLISSFLIALGLGYFLLDQANNILVQGNKADLEAKVWKPSLILLCTGYAMRLIHKRSQRIRYPAKLLRAERGSRFYKSDP